MKFGYSIDNRLSDLPSNPFRRRAQQAVAKTEAGLVAAEAERPRNWAGIFAGQSLAEEPRSDFQGFGFARGAMS